MQRHKLNSLRTRLSTAALLLAFVLQVAGQEIPKAKPESVGMSSARLTQLSSVLDGYANDGKLPGGVAMVMRKGKVAFVHSFGKRDREANSPMTEDTIFRIASQSKALTSVAIMMLQEDGRLLVSDNLSKYIPEFANSTVAVPKDGGGYEVVKAKRQITIRDLLTHTSGVSYGFGPAKDKWEAAKIQNWYFADRDEPIAETVKRMAALPMDAHPGEKFVYGYSTDILGVVIEKVSGKTLEEFLNERIIKPLDMKDTSFYLPANKTSRFAAVYSVKDGKLERAADPGLGVSQGHYINGPRKSFSGGAGLLSTPRDYGRFLQMLVNGGELNGKRLLSRKSVEQMTVDQLRDIKYSSPGQGFGLGFSVVKNVGEYGQPSSVGEFGWGGAYHSNYWVNPQEQLVVVYMTQVIPATGLDDYGKLRAMIYSSLID